MLLSIVRNVYCSLAIDSCFPTVASLRITKFFLILSFKASWCMHVDSQGTPERNTNGWVTIAFGRVLVYTSIHHSFLTQYDLNDLLSN